MALAHTVENKVEAPYRRGDLLQKRRDLMQDWATFVAGAARPHSTSEARRGRNVAHPSAMRRFLVELHHPLFTDEVRELIREIGRRTPGGCVARIGWVRRLALRGRVA
jgi:hypothetical protein